jgi:hypothetical protein
MSIRPLYVWLKETDKSYHRNQLPQYKRSVKGRERRYEIHPAVEARHNDISFVAVSPYNTLLDQL